MTLPRLVPHPVTAPWCGGPTLMFSWECVHPGGSAAGISRTEHGAMRAVTETLREHGGQGLVQKCMPGATGNEADGYLYGDLIARARVEGDLVVWATP